MKIVKFFVVLAFAFAASAANAGRNCELTQPAPEELRKSLNLAEKSRAALEKADAQVALVARVGRDLSKYGLRYSHFGYVWRDHPDGRWLMIHKLNDCGKAEGHLYTEGLGNFFADDLFAYEAWILVPTPAVQARLAETFSQDFGRAFHRVPYSIVSYPFSTRYQNSNAWALEVLASAMSETPVIKDSRAAQAWLEAEGYRPSRLRLGPLTRLGGRAFKANVAFDDHPPDLRWNNLIDTVTVDSAFSFAMKKGAVQQSIEIKL